VPRAFWLGFAAGYGSVPEGQGESASRSFPVSGEVARRNNLATTASHIDADTAESVVYEFVRQTGCTVNYRLDCLASTEWDYHKALDFLCVAKESCENAPSALHSKPDTPELAPMAPPARPDINTAHQMVLKLCEMTKLKLEYCEDCLDRADWNMVRASSIFAQRAPNLPPKAFLAAEQQSAEEKVKEVARRTGLTLQ